MPKKGNNEMTTQTKGKASSLRSRAAMSVCFALDDTASKAPTELRMWKAGWTDTDYGRFLFDQQAADAIMDKHRKRGNRLTWYFGHPETDDRKYEDRKSAGSFALEVRQTPQGPELWMVDIKWADGVADMITSKQWLYFSPSCAYDTKTRRLEDIFNCALTNEPATHKAKLLAASRKVTFAEGIEDPELETKLQEALNVLIPPEGESVNDIVEIGDGWVVYERDGLFWSIDYELVDGDVKLTGEPVDVTESYQTAEAFEQPTIDLTAELQKALDELLPPTEEVFNEIIKTTDSLVVYRRDGRTWSVEYKITGNGVELVGDPEELLDMARNDTITRLLRLTGASSAKAALATVEAWKQSTRALQLAHRQLEAFRTQAAARKVTELLAEAKQQRKVTPVMMVSLREKGLEDPNWLESYLKALPVLPTLTVIGGTRTRETTYETMSYKQRAEMYRKDKATFDAVRAEYLARRAQQNEVK